jgi:hypothetical protein
MGLQNIHKNPYNFPNMKLCVGSSSDMRVEATECAK